MPCWELFEECDEVIQQTVLPDDLPALAGNADLHQPPGPVGVGVDGLRRVLQGLDAEGSLQRDRHPPRQNPRYPRTTRPCCMCR